MPLARLVLVWLAHTIAGQSRPARSRPMMPEHQDGYFTIRISRLQLLHARLDKPSKASSIACKICAYLLAPWTTKSRSRVLHLLHLVLAAGIQSSTNSS